MYLNKGKISTIVSQSQATVVPAFSPAPVTPPLVIPYFLRGGLSVGTDVVYVQFPDNTGLILGRMDGEDTAGQK